MDIEIHCNTNDETLFRNIGINSQLDVPWVTEVALKRFAGASRLARRFSR